MVSSPGTLSSSSAPEVTCSPPLETFDQTGDLQGVFLTRLCDLRVSYLERGPGLGLSDFTICGASAFLCNLPLFLMFLQDLEEGLIEELNWKLLQLLRHTVRTQISLEGGFLSLCVQNNGRTLCLSVVCVLAALPPAPIDCRCLFPLMKSFHLPKLRKPLLSEGRRIHRLEISFGLAGVNGAVP